MVYLYLWIIIFINKNAYGMLSNFQAMTEFYVSNHGSDKYECESEEHACQHIKYAVKLAQMRISKTPSANQTIAVINVDGRSGIFGSEDLADYVRITSDILIRSYRAPLSVLDCTNRGHRLFDIGTQQKNTNTRTKKNHKNKKHNFTNFNFTQLIIDEKQDNNQVNFKVNNALSLTFENILLKNCNGVKRDNLVEPAMFIGGENVNITFVSSHVRNCGLVIKSRIDSGNKTTSSKCKNAQVFVLSGSTLKSNMVVQPFAAGIYLSGCLAVKMTLQYSTLDDTPIYLNPSHDLDLFMRGVLISGPSIKGTGCDITLGAGSNLIDVSNVSVNGFTGSRNGAFNFYMVEQPPTTPIIFIRDSVFHANRNTRGNGGAISFQALFSHIQKLTLNAKISNVTFLGNQAHHRGGSIYIRGIRNVALHCCNFTNNRARVGGAIFMEGVTQTSISESRFCNNTARRPSDSAPHGYSEGGAIRLETSGNIRINNSHFEGNQAVSSGSSISSSKVWDLHLTNLNFINSSDNVIYISSSNEERDVKMSNLTIVSNSANQARRPLVSVNGLVTAVNNLYVCAVGHFAVPEAPISPTKNHSLNIKNSKYTEKNLMTPRNLVYSQLVVWCDSCPMDTYSFQQGVSGDSMPSVQPPCHSCPILGVRCQQGQADIYEGYWPLFKLQENLTTALLTNILTDRNVLQRREVRVSLIKKLNPERILAMYQCAPGRCRYSGFENRCRRGYTGVMCSKCSDGYYPQFKGVKDAGDVIGHCTDRPKNQPVVITVSVLLFLLILTALLTSSRLVGWMHQVVESRRLRTSLKKDEVEHMIRQDDEETLQSVGLQPGHDFEFSMFVGNLRNRSSRKLSLAWVTAVKVWIYNYQLLWLTYQPLADQNSDWRSTKSFIIDWFLAFYRLQPANFFYNFQQNRSDSDSVAAPLIWSILLQLCILIIIILVVLTRRFSQRLSNFLRDRYSLNHFLPVLIQTVLFTHISATASCLLQFRCYRVEKQRNSLTSSIQFICLDGDSRLYLLYLSLFAFPQIFSIGILLKNIGSTSIITTGEVFIALYLPALHLVFKSIRCISTKIRKVVFRSENQSIINESDFVNNNTLDCLSSELSARYHLPFLSKVPTSVDTLDDRENPRTPLSWMENWEFWLLIRRTIMVLVATLLAPWRIVRAFITSLLVIAFLAFHTYRSPYRLQRANLTETCFLFLIGILSLIATVKNTAYASGVVWDSGWLDEVSSGYQWAYLILTVIGPIGFLISIIVFYRESISKP